MFCVRVRKRRSKDGILDVVIKVGNEVNRGVV